jgi:hypothetical protein
MRKPITLFVVLVAFVVALYTITVRANITGVNISGSNVYGGSGNEVLLNSSGVTITAGSGTVNKVKWDNGSYIAGDGTYTVIGSPNQIKFYASGGSQAYEMIYGSFYPEGTAASLGASSFPWSALFVTPPTTTSGYDPLVLNTADNQVYRKTNGWTGSCSSPTTLNVVHGIVVGCS